MLASFSFVFCHGCAKKGEPGVTYSSEVARAESPCICPKPAMQVHGSGLFSRSLVTISSVTRHIQVSAWSSSGSGSLRRPVISTSVVDDLPLADSKYRCLLEKNSQAEDHGIKGLKQSPGRDFLRPLLKARYLH